jgi:hypothetical protein
MATITARIYHVLALNVSGVMPNHRLNAL